ncbi:MAG TPA: Hsp20 family protein, partial [Polyangiaceae bacterium]|nr:Hsp20 family protein [Polyangiaceae bacterium]
MLVLVDLPGVDPARVALTLGSHALYLEVNVPSDVVQPGIAGGHHEVTVELPDGLGPDALDASFSDGVLRVRISKVEAGVRHIGVTSLDE